MKWYVLATVFISVLIAVYMLPDTYRFAKTLLLIARVTPYEQTGTGAGKIHVLGDSTGYGTGASRAKYSVAGRLGADYPTYSITNQSVNGRTIAGLLTDTTDFAGEYDLILLQIGGNDILQKRDTGEVLEDVETLIARLAPHTKEIVMLTSGNVGGAAAFSDAEAAELERLTRAYRTGLIELGETTQHFTYVDLFDEPGSDPFREHPVKYTSFDDLHPNNDGYGLWYRKAQAAFANALK